MRADRFEPLPPETLARWEGFPNWPEHTIFPTVVGLVVEEIRADYCRMRLPYRPDLRQPAGVVHGGAIATLIDTVVVPALAWPYDQVPKLLTITLNIRFRGALFEEDGVAEGWIDTRGRSTVSVAPRWSAPIPARSSPTARSSTRCRRCNHPARDGYGSSFLVR